MTKPINNFQFSSNNFSCDDNNLHFNIVYAKRKNKAKIQKNEANYFICNNKLTPETLQKCVIDKKYPEEKLYIYYVPHDNKIFYVKIKFIDKIIKVISTHPTNSKPKVVKA